MGTAAQDTHGEVIFEGEDIRRVAGQHWRVVPSEQGALCVPWNRDEPPRRLQGRLMPRRGSANCHHLSVGLRLLYSRSGLTSSLAIVSAAGYLRASFNGIKAKSMTQWLVLFGFIRDVVRCQVWADDVPVGCSGVARHAVSRLCINEQTCSTRSPGTSTAQTT